MPIYASRVLVVDDVKTQRILMRSLLTTVGYGNVLEASNGVEALQILDAEKSKGRPVEVVISDWNMPQLTGLDLLKQIRASHSLKDVLFAFSTIEGDPTGRQTS